MRGREEDHNPGEGAQPPKAPPAKHDLPSTPCPTCSRPDPTPPGWLTAALADDPTSKEGWPAFTALICGAIRAPEKTTKVWELERPCPSSLPPPWDATKLLGSPEAAK